MEISNLSEAKLKTLFTRMLRNLTEGPNSIKKFQSETMDTLIEMNIGGWNQEGGGAGWGRGSGGGVNVDNCA